MAKLGPRRGINAAYADAENQMALTIHYGALDIPAEAGEAIVEAMLRFGQPFPHSCQQGNCGTCRCSLIDGHIFELPHSEFALTPSDRERGIILGCRTDSRAPIGRCRRLCTYCARSSRIVAPCCDLSGARA